MRKFLIILLIVFIPLFPVFSDGEEISLNPESWWSELWTDAHFSYDVFIRSTLLRGDYNVGGGLSLGVTTDRFRFESYFQGDYFFTPMGNTYISPLEFDLETGLTLGWKFLEVGNFDVYIAGDIGYFMQFTSYHEPSGIFMNENGFMVRAKLVTELPIVRYYSISLGVYYQTPIFPHYQDYSGLGIVFSIA